MREIAVVFSLVIGGVVALGVIRAAENVAYARGGDSCECRELRRIRQILEFWSPIPPPGIPGDGNPGGGGPLE